MSQENPLLARNGLPLFSVIQPAHVESGVSDLIAELRETLQALEENVQPTWEGVVVPLEALGDRLGSVWGTVGHLMGVRNSDALREAFDRVQPEVVRFALAQGQSRPIYRALEGLQGGKNWSALDAAQKRIVESRLLRGSLSRED